VIVDRQRPVLITGGAGFIGVNLADRLLGAGQPVLIFDDLSRAGVRENLTWLRRHHAGAPCDVIAGDVRDGARVREAVRRSCAVFHLAAQVAVTGSLRDPAADFAVNAAGTLNVLEAVRQTPHAPPLIYTSTNKVYGSLAGVQVFRLGDRYVPRDPALRERGVSESTPLAFASPYGCSKGAADQYVLDYARVFGLRTVVFRMSCIYGPHQRGTEDQGWVAHFLLRALARSPITIYGDGYQVRDLLYVTDLLDALEATLARIDRLAGRAFNVGGGPERTASLRDVIDIIASVVGRPPELRFGPWRPADQLYYVSDVRALAEATSWRPTVSVAEGVQRLCESLRQSLPARPAAGEPADAPVEAA
jgi:CDP-paratose 2-epimerase